MASPIGIGGQGWFFSVHCGGGVVGAAAGGRFASLGFGTKGSGIADPRWHVPQVIGSVDMRLLNWTRYLVLRSAVILIITRAFSLTGFASEGKSVRLVS